jgi:tRNA pseudouridine38-40 synthase
MNESDISCVYSNGKSYLDKFQGQRNIKIIIEFDGSNYSGWQRQKNAKTVEQTLENSIFKLTGEQIEVFGCSRTDAGVHAKEYVANFHTNSSIPGDRFKAAINTKLPEDIVIYKSEEVQPGFHARYLNKGKTYSYTILNRDYAAAMYRNYCQYVRKSIDIELMKSAAELFIGKHDFSAFRNTGSSSKTTIRNVSNIEIIKNEDILKIFITADGFLYNMARIISGTLLDVGTGKMKIINVKKALETGNRKLAGKRLKAEGLCLEKVYY